MARILAIEADPKRQRLLTALVREHVKAELVMADSVKAAIRILEEKIPDLIIAPTLLTPADEGELMAHLRQLHAAPYVQTLTVPALDMLASEPAQQERRRFGLIGQILKPGSERRRPHLGPQYDRGIVGAQIVDGLERARTARLEHEAVTAYEEERDRRRKMEVAAITTAGLGLIDQAAAEIIAEHKRQKSEGDERRTAERKSLGDVPWLSAIKLSWDVEVSLVNISSSGVLVETGSKFVPGSVSELHLTGPDTNLVMPVRFIRTEVARIDGLGVKYHAAAAFESELDLVRPRRQEQDQRSASQPQALAELLAQVLAESDERPEPAPARFATGLRELVRARDVQIRTAPMSPSGGRETLYFDIPGADRSCGILQVVFERNYDVSDSEFRLLKAAAWLAAALLEFDRPAQPVVKLLSDRVA
jgi:CheY-like chemotaxis protein